MNNSTLNILQVSTSDIGGGGEKIAWSLFQSYKDFGHKSILAVGTKNSDDPNVLCIPNNEYRSFVAKFGISCSSYLKPIVGKIPIIELINKGIIRVSEPKRTIDKLQGKEDFDYPGSTHLLELIKDRIDILHCHNLHGGYFDLRTLIELSSQIPVFITLHDAWLLSGHCAHSFECERWKNGCGNCPDLTIYPSINKDSTTYNWQRKKNIFSKSHLYVATPSRWLMDKVNESILKPGVNDYRVIPNGVNTKIFHPYIKRKAREELGLKLDEKIILVTANGIRENIFKDYKTLRSSLLIISKCKKRVLCIAVGEDAPTEYIDSVEVKFVPFQNDPSLLARYYQAADIYVHPSRAESFSLTVLEAMACGIPVVASKVGGIPEVAVDRVTGFLVPVGNAEEMAEKIIRLLENEALRQEMGENAAKVAVQRFSLDSMINEYLRYYKDILKI